MKLTDKLLIELLTKNYIKMSLDKIRITDKMLSENFEEYENGYWNITDEVIISAEGHLYAIDDLDNRNWFGEIHFLEDLRNLLSVLKWEGNFLYSF